MLRNKRMILVGCLLAVAFCGCTHQASNAPNLSTEEADAQDSPYDVFVQKIRSENRDNVGVDIVALLDAHLDKCTGYDGLPYLSADLITNIDYTIEMCNFTQKGESSPNDIVGKIAASRHSMFTVDTAYMTVVFAYILNQDGVYDLVFDEEVISRLGCNNINKKQEDPHSDSAANQFRP